jgi:hypothetical protein
MLNKEEKKELENLAKSPKLQGDMAVLSKRRYNPFIVNGNIDIDRLLIFLTDYNYFINHALKSFHRIIDKDMRL